MGDFEAVGKPNQLMSFSGVDHDNTFVMNQLANMSPEEFVETAEQLASGQGAASNYRKIFDNIVKENEDNEYSRTKVGDKHGLKKALVPPSKKNGFKLNQARSPRILESFGGRDNRNKNSYINMKLRESKNRA